MNEEFDISVEGAHVVTTETKQFQGVNFEILEVTGTKPGEKPVVKFTVKNDAGTGLALSALSRLRLLLAGSNADYMTYITEDALRAESQPGEGLYRYTFTAAIPATANGSWTIAIEGRQTVRLDPAPPGVTTANDAGLNRQYYFSVDGTPVQPRRKVVEMSKCNACHSDLAFHGGSRNTIEQCVICHNPTATANPEPRRTIDMGVMIHKIHRGHALTRGYGIANANYSEIGYPGDLRSCVSCHISGTQQVPDVDNRMKVVSPYDFISPAGRTSANCLACHDSQGAAAHASTNTDPKLGEACSACHGPTGAAAVDKVHAR
jgi:OmcA/MtrC family decaheme c-type cytochrome